MPEKGAPQAAVVNRPRIAVEARDVDHLSSDDATAWDALHAAQSGASNPFASRLWVSAWYRHFVPARHRLLLWVTERDRLIGVAPLHREDLAIGPASVARRLHLVGAGRSTPLEIPPLLCAQGKGRAVARAVLESALTRDVTWTELCLSREHGWLATQDVTTSDGDAVFSHHQGVRACVILPLGSSWQETRGGLKRNAKESVRRALNRLAKDGRPWAVHHRVGEALDELVTERLLRLHTARSRNTRSSATHPDAFSDPSVAGFMRDLLPQLGRGHQASVVELELDGQVVAAQLVLHPPGGVYFHSSGFLPSVWDLSPITALQVDAMQAAVERGEGWVNFSPGPNEAKLRWSDDLALWTDVAVGPARRRGMAVYTAFALVKNARQLGRERARDVRAAASRTVVPGDVRSAAETT